MFVLRRLPALLALLMLGAHFLRFSQTPLVLLCLVLLAPLFILRPWCAGPWPWEPWRGCGPWWRMSASAWPSASPGCAWR